MSKLTRIVFGLSLLFLSFNEVFAQATNFGYTPVGVTQTLSVTSASGSVTLNASPGDSVIIQNTGANTAFVKCAATSTTSDFPVQSGWSIVLNCPPNNRIAAITASSTTSLYITKGLGPTTLAATLGSVTITPSGTQAVNITQILGATPSLTNPLWVFPATGATFPVSGSVTIAEPVLSSTSTTALAANLVVNAAASGLYSFTVSADSTLYGAVWYIMIYNATAAPGDGAVTPLKCYEMPANTYTYTAAFPNPIPFSTGIVIGVSTTGCFTKTASTHALFISGDYK